MDSFNKKAYEEIINSAEFNLSQKHIIRNAFNPPYKLTIDEIKIFAKPYIPYDQMSLFLFNLQEGFPVEQLKLMTNSKFDVYQMSELFSAIGKCLNNDQFEILANPELNALQMREICKGFEYELSTEQVKSFAKPEFNAYQMEVIRQAYISGLNSEQASVLLNPRFNVNQIITISKAFEKGLSLEKIRVFAKPVFDNFQMSEIITAFEDGLSMEQIEVFAKPEFHNNQMKLIVYAFNIGLTMEQVKCVADYKFDTEEMDEKIIEFFADNAPSIPLYVDSYKHAKANNEIKLWQQSYTANIFCKNVIEKAIKTNFDGFAITDGVEKSIVDKYGINRVTYVLANTIQHNEDDLHFSMDNREWSKSISIFDDTTPQGLVYRKNFVVKIHPALIDDFVSRVREYIIILNTKPSLEEQIRGAEEQKHSPNNTGTF